MKTTTLLILALLTLPTFAKEELRSKELRKDVCEAIQFELDDEDKYFWSGDLPLDECVKGRFTITDSKFDERLNVVTLMTVEFATEAAPFKPTGEAELVRTFSIGKDGKSQSSWGVRELTLLPNDTRGPKEIVEYLREEDLLDVHNGDAGVESGKLKSQKQVASQLEKWLENDPESSCVYSTDTSTEWVMHSLKTYSPALLTYILRLQESGQLAHVTSREYSDGESESCSHYYFEIYLKDGTRIYFHGDYTT